VGTRIGAGQEVGEGVGDGVEGREGFQFDGVLRGGRGDEVR
jgi:hypothetical protein